MIIIITHDGYFAILKCSHMFFATLMIASMSFSQFSDLPADVQLEVTRKLKGDTPSARALRETAKAFAQDNKPDKESALILNIVRALDTYDKYSEVPKQMKSMAYSMDAVYSITKHLKDELKTYKRIIKDGVKNHEQFAKMTPVQRGDHLVQKYILSSNDDYVEVKHLLYPLINMIREFGKKNIVFDEDSYEIIHKHLHPQGAHQYNHNYDVPLDDAEQIELFNLVDSVRPSAIGGKKKVSRKRKV